MRFKIDWASLIVGRKFTVFALFYFVFEGNFQVQAPLRAFIWRGDLTEVFVRYKLGGGGGGLYLGGLIHGGGYFWNFTVLCSGLLFYHVKFHRVLYLCTRSGAHNPERATPLCPGAQRFKDHFILRSIFSRNFEHQVSHYKSIGKTGDLKTVFLMLLIAFTSFRFLSYYG